MVLKTGYARLGFVVAVVMLLVGCTKIASSDKSPAPDEPKISESELRAYCPRVMLPDEDAFYTIYERGGEADSSRIVYQVAIDKVTRACRYEGGQILMEVAAAGRVVPGPKFNLSQLNLPIYVRAKRGSELLYDKTNALALSSLARGEATQFIFKDEAVMFEQPSARNVFVFVGFNQSRR